MSWPIRWTLEAEETLDEIISDLEDRWTEKEIKKFLKRVSKILLHIGKYPFMYESSALRPDIRKAVVAKQCSLFYQIREETVVLLYFWDNRRDHTKLSNEE